MWTKSSDLGFKFGRRRLLQAATCAWLLPTPLALPIACGARSAAASRFEESKTVAGGGLCVEWPNGATQVQIMVERETTVVEILDQRGIGRAALRTQAERWPTSVMLRLRLKGLESLKAADGRRTLEWSVGSTDQATRCVLRVEQQETELKAGDAYFAPVRVASTRPMIPLADGAFEVSLPRKLLADDPERLELHWIDFYRG
ncbi:MAG: hypothetical protein U0939_18410 [Pirellulales bacterium]